MKKKLATILLIVSIISGIFAIYGTYSAKIEYDDLISEEKVQYAVDPYSNTISSAITVVKTKNILKKLYFLEALCVGAMATSIVMLANAKKE